MGRDKEKNLMDSELRSMTNAASRMNFSSSKAYVNNFDLEKATFNKNTKVAASLSIDVSSRRFAKSNQGGLTTSTRPQRRQLSLKFPTVKQSAGAKKCAPEAASLEVSSSTSRDPSVRNFYEKEQRDTFSENMKVAANPTNEINSNVGRLSPVNRPRRHFHFPVVKQSSGEKKCAPLITSIKVPSSWSFDPSTKGFAENEQSSLGATSVKEPIVESFDTTKKGNVVDYLRRNNFNFNDPQIPHDRILLGKSELFYIVSKDLVSVSGYFKKLFSVWEPGSRVDLPTFCNIRWLSAFLRFIYDDPSITDPNAHNFTGVLKSVLRASQKFEAPIVEKKCIDLLVSTVSPGNIDKMRKIAQAFDIEQLKIGVERVMFDLVRPSGNSWNLGCLIPMMKAITGRSSGHTKKRTCNYVVAVFDSLLDGSSSKAKKIKPDYLITRADVDRACETKYGHLFDRTDVVGRKVNQSEFSIFLQFIEDADNFDVSQLDSVIKLARLFDFEEIVETGKKLILDNLNQNFFIATKVAFLYDLADLKEKIIDLVVGREGSYTSLGYESRFMWNSEYFLANSQKFNALPQSLKQKIIVSILGYPDLACAKAHHF